jgi:hypothetical protein
MQVAKKGYAFLIYVFSTSNVESLHHDPLPLIVGLLNQINNVKAYTNIDFCGA